MADQMKPTQPPGKAPQQPPGDRYPTPSQGTDRVQPGYRKEKDTPAKPPSTDEAPEAPSGGDRP